MTSRRGLAAGVLVLVCGWVSLGCADSEDARVAARAEGFMAELSGAVSGRVAGPGRVHFLPPAEVVYGTRPGYFFIADDTGVRELGITFTIPAGTEPGRYELVSPPPLESGEAFEVRLDRSVGDRTESFASDTEGTITLLAFSKGAEAVAGGRVAGRFAFSTRDREGREVEVEGSFDFVGG